MRISTHQSQQTAINAMLEQQEKLSKVQQQVATGRKIFKPSEDPVAASKIVNLNETLATMEQHQSNIGAARARLDLEEGVLSNTTDVLQRVRELAVMANNDSQTNESRSFIAEEAEQLLQELLGLANSTDSNGEYMFSGSKSDFKPFTRNEFGEYDYHGDNGQRFMAIAPMRQISTGDSGTAVFRDIRDGNGDFIILDNKANSGTGIADPGNVLDGYDGKTTYAIEFATVPPAVPGDEPYLSYFVFDETGAVIVPLGTPYESGNVITFAGVSTSIEGEPDDGDFFVVRPSLNQDVFTTISRFVDILREPVGNPSAHARLHNEVNRTLVGLDTAMGNIFEIRSNVGARLNALDGQEDINQAYRIQIKSILSDVQDLDYAEAVSDLNLKLTGLEASQKAFTRIQGLSMFNYM